MDTGDEDDSAERAKERASQKLQDDLRLSAELEIIRQWAIKGMCHDERTDGTTKLEAGPLFDAYNRVRAWKMGQWL